MRRRDLLALTAAAAFVPLAAPALAAAPQTAGAPKRLVVILLRGAVDGLDVVIPYAEEAYYAARPTIAIAAAREAGEGAGLALDDHFALHPALAALMPLWRERQLAFVHAAGSSDPTRSHFDAQLFVENGTPGRHATADGWMNRLLAALPGPRGPTDAIAIGPTLPQILRGRLAVANLPLGQAAGHRWRSTAPKSAAVSTGSTRATVRSAVPTARAAPPAPSCSAQIGPEPQAADGGSLPANGFPAQAARLAQLLVATGVSVSPSSRSAAGIRMSARAAHTGQLAERAAAAG